MNWNRLSGRQQKLLRETIISAFVGSANLDMFLQGELGWPPLRNIVPSGPFQEEIFNLINVSQADGSTDKLVEALQKSKSNNVLVQNLPDAIRAAGAEAPPRLSSSSMEFEKIVRGGGFADIRAWAESLVEISKATCRIECPAHIALGTGILLASDLVLTNYHVVEEHLCGRADVGKVVCRFDYARDVSETYAGTAIGLATGAGWIVAQSPYDHADTGGTGLSAPDHLDFALIRLETALEDRKPVAIDVNPVSVSDGSPVLIVQHPEGLPQVLAIGKSLGPNGNGSRLRYDADTLPGSSGSGVFNQRLELVALHHAGDPTSPLRATYNQGIPIGLIRSKITLH
jgi:hypothetical protein